MDIGELRSPAKRSHNGREGAGGLYVATSRTIEGLMESFATAGLGLELKGRIQDLRPSPHRVNLDAAVFVPCAAAWHTDRGVATLRVVYDEAKSMRAKAHVLKIAWWIGEEHHDGWWHCYPKFPRDWIKGIGRA